MSSEGEGATKSESANQAHTHTHTHTDRQRQREREHRAAPCQDDDGKQHTWRGEGRGGSSWQRETSCCTALSALEVEDVVPHQLGRSTDEVKYQPSSIRFPNKAFVFS